MDDEGDGGLSSQLDCQAQIVGQYSLRKTIVFAELHEFAIAEQERGKLRVVHLWAVQPLPQLFADGFSIPNR